MKYVVLTASMTHWTGESIQTVILIIRYLQLQLQEIQFSLEDLSQALGQMGAIILRILEDGSLVLNSGLIWIQVGSLKFHGKVRRMWRK